MSHNCVIISTAGQSVNLESLKGCCVDSFFQDYNVSSANFGREFKFKTLFNGQEIEFKIKDGTFKVPRSNLVIGELFEFKGYGRLKVESLEIPKKKFKKSMLENEFTTVHSHEIETDNLTNKYSILPQKDQVVIPSKPEYVLPSFNKKIVIPG